MTKTPPPAPDKRSDRMRLLRDKGRPVPPHLTVPATKGRAKAKATKEIKGGSDK